MPTPPIRSTGAQPQAIPPPQANSSTPIRKNLQGSEHYAVSHSKVDAEVLKTNMAGELAGQWVGPMPVEDFISTFLPLPENTIKTQPLFSPTFFNELVKQGFETNMYDPFISLVASSGAMPGFKLINTSQHADRDAITGMKNKPDVSGYRIAVDTEEHPTKYEDMELIFEFKPPRAEADPFQDKPKELPPTSGKRLKFPFEPTADEREKCRGQLACYARVWCARQHRTHCFVVWIGDPHARIIRFDRSGGVVSAKFNYRTHGDLLLKFLWSHSISSDDARGMDQTVTKASPEEATTARDNLFEWKPSSARSVFKLQIPDPIKGDETRTRSVLIWGPLADPRSVTGRATRGYPAWYPDGNKGKGCVVFVKDSWRSCEPGMEKESDILKELNASNIPHVPKLICGDDLPGQFTITQNYINEKWNKGGCGEHFVKRVHTRFAEDVIGYHLNKFDSSRELFQAVYDAFLAHKLAFEKCGILHRDISAGNILMKKGGGGILNDWDLAKRIKKEKIARQPFRSGTFQYMSAGLLRNPLKFNSVQDDMESFFWVVLYHVLRYMKHNHPEEKLEEDMYDIFDRGTAHTPGQHAEGGKGKYVLFMLREPLKKTFAVINNEPLTTFVKSTIANWKEWYQYPMDVEEDIEKLAKLKKISEEEAKKQIPFDTSTLAMANHDAMLSIFSDALALDSWPKGDEAFDRLPEQDKRVREDIVREDVSADSSTVEGASIKKRPRTHDDAAYKGRNSRHGSSFADMAPQTLFPVTETQEQKKQLNKIYPNGILQ